MKKKLLTGLIAAIIAISLIGCTVQTNTNESSTTPSLEASSAQTSDIFTERDLEQEVDLSDAISLTVTNGENVTLTSEGIYIFSGRYENVTILVEAADDDKVQIVLDGYQVENTSAPALYVKSCDKVFITTTGSTNSMTVTGNFQADGDTNLDAVIFSRSDLVFSGEGTLSITSNYGNGISSKDDIKITGGTYTVETNGDGFEANDGIYISAGDFDMVSDKDAFHSENTDDLTVGEIHVSGGSFKITAADDAFQGSTRVTIDGGEIAIDSCTEGIEATVIEINGGTINMYATDDGINASKKSNLAESITVNGGNIIISMAGGDTDAFDSNGAIAINGGIIDISAASAFDSDGTASLNGGTVTVNGEVITEITQMQMGPGAGGKVRPVKRP